MSDFYLTLPSNSAPSTNTTAKFSVYLPQNIELPGKWEVALVEIQYPFSWNNLSGNLTVGDTTDNWIEVTFLNGYVTTLAVPPGYYETIHDVLAAINYAKHESALELKKQAIAELPKDKVFKTWKKELMLKHPKVPIKRRVLKDHSKSIVQGFYVSYIDTVKRTRVKKDPARIKKVRFSPRLQYMLGLHEEEVMKDSFLAKYLPDLRGGFYALYVYCSLVEPQIVGNNMAPLLRLVNVEGVHGSIVEKIFQSPHYVPVVTKEITRIDIEIKDDNNQPVPFDFGKSVLKLHVRKRRPLL